MSMTAAEKLVFSPDRLIDAMRAKDMTTQDLANEIGASVEAVGRWVSGLAAPRKVSVTSAARALDVEVDDLYE